MKTFSPKPVDVTRQWYILDASQIPLGRLSTTAASLLIGKGKPRFAPHLDSGDHVIIVNAANLVVTGQKTQQKTYYRHSGYPGGLKSRTLSEQLTLDPTRVIMRAVRGMLPVNKLRDGRLARLRVYPGAEHPHDPQQPKPVTLKRKESR